MPVEYQIDSKDLDRQIQKLNQFDRTYRRYMNVALGDASMRILLTWRDVAPKDTGYYHGTLKQKVRRLIGGEMVGHIWTDARSRKGFPYPAALETDPRYHYRRTMYRGQPTMGHVKRVVKRKSKEVLKVLKQAIDRITKELAIK